MQQQVSHALSILLLNLYPVKTEFEYIHSRVKSPKFSMSLARPSHAYNVTTPLHLNFNSVACVPSASTTATQQHEAVLRRQRGRRRGRRLQRAAAAGLQKAGDCG